MALPTQKHHNFLSIFFISKNLTALALVKIIPLKSEKLICHGLTLSILTMEDEKLDVQRFKF